MALRRGFNWGFYTNAFKDEASADARATFMKFKAAFDSTNARLDNISDQPEAIDWAHWKKEIRNPIVADWEKAAATLPKDGSFMFDHPTAKAQLELFEKETAALIAETDKVVSRIAPLKVAARKELQDAIRFREQIDGVSQNEFMEKNPELQAEINRNIGEAQWDPTVLRSEMKADHH